MLLRRNQLLSSKGYVFCVAGNRNCNGTVGYYWLLDENGKRSCGMGLCNNKYMTMTSAMTVTINKNGKYYVRTAPNTGAGYAYNGQENLADLPFALGGTDILTNYSTNNTCACAYIVGKPNLNITYQESRLNSALTITLLYANEVLYWCYGNIVASSGMSSYISGSISEGYWALYSRMEYSTKWYTRKDTNATIASKGLVINDPYYNYPYAFYLGDA